MCGETSGKRVTSGDRGALKRQRALLAQVEKAAVWMHWEERPSEDATACAGGAQRAAWGSAEGGGGTR